MSSFSIRQVLFLGLLAITLILVTQSYWLLKTLDLSERAFQEKASIALSRAANEMSEYQQVTLPIEQLVVAYASNYFIVNYNQEINPQALEYYLTKNLSASLTEDFEYAVYDCSSKSMVYGKHIEPISGRTPIPPYRFETHEGYPYYFGVRFPHHTAYLLQDAWIALVFSGIMLLAVGFFIYAMVVILQQKRFSEMQRDFINTMTHEFKTPISTVKIATEVLGNSEIVKQEPRLAQYTHILQDQNQRLNQLVEKVLVLARYEQERFRLSTENLDLNEGVREVFAIYSPLLEAQKGQLTLNLESSPLPVSADRVHLVNVLSNLLDNSIKYSDAPKSIVIETRLQRKGYLLVVADQGRGIPEKYRKRVFQRFFRVPRGNTQDASGFGLGLYYVQAVCEKHGWKIACRNNQPQGTRFEISIPFSSPKPPA